MLPSASVKIESKTHLKDNRDALWLGLDLFDLERQLELVRV